MCWSKIFKGKKKDVQEVSKADKIRQQTQNTAIDHEVGKDVTNAINEQQETFKGIGKEIIGVIDDFSASVNAGLNKYRTFVLQEEEICAKMKEEVGKKIQTNGKNIETQSLFNAYKRRQDAFDKYKQELNSFEAAADLAVGIHSSIRMLAIAGNFKLILEMVDPNVIKMLKGFNDSMDVAQMIQILENINEKMSDRRETLINAAADLHNTNRANADNYNSNNFDAEFDAFADSFVNVSTPVENSANNNADNNTNNDVNNPAGAYRQAKN